LGFAWLALGYDIFCPFTPLDEIFEIHINMFGRPLLGYWKFFEQESAAATIEKNVSVRQALLVHLNNQIAQSLNHSFACCIQTTTIAG
jgi:hypothetical protein